ncbi:MAG: hypothetical protein HY865_21730 [Chloroflexi bacterium]|nr:hypothetical protein [Chloroflexota bacterium]
MSKRIFHVLLIVFQLAAFSYYAFLRIDNAGIVHEPRAFGDTADYFRNADLPVFSSEFWTSPRPPVTALFWKLAGADPERIFDLQLYFSILCWGVLAITVVAVVRNKLLKPFAFALVLAFSLSRDVYMWDPFLGSESIGLSFMALFLASAIWLLTGWSWWNAACLVFTALALALTRDTYAYLLLMVAAVSFVVFLPGRYRWHAAGVSLALVLIFAFSSKLAGVALRPYDAILMNTALRIYPSEEYTEYFRHHGMPVDDRLVQLARNPQPGEKFAVYLSLRRDKDQEDYRQWAHGVGRTEYLKFLWFFKAVTFQSVFTETPSASFYPDVYYYTATGYHPIITDARISELLYPTRFGLVFFFGANLFAAFVAALAWRDRKALWLAPLLMVLLAYPQAVLVWAADVNDVARHSVPHNVLFRLGAWLLIFFIADTLLADLPARFFKRKESTA